MTFPKLGIEKHWSVGRFTAEILSGLTYTLRYLIALIFWELLLRTQIGFQGATAVFLLFLPAEAMFLSVFTGWLKPKLNRIITPIVLLLPFVFYVSQLIYFRIFGSLFSVSMIGLGTNAVENFGWALWDTVKGSVGWILLCFLPVGVSVFVSVFAPEKVFKGSRPLLHLSAVIKTVVLWLLAVLMLLPFGTGDYSPYYAYSSSYIDTDTASNRLGVLTNSVVELGHLLFGDSKKQDMDFVAPSVPDGFGSGSNAVPNTLSGVDFATLKNMTDDKGKQALCDYLASVSGTNKNEHTGLLKDYNLIYICAESFCNLAIEPDVTPTLYKLSQGGFVLNNYYNSYKNTTTNGEFSFMTGLWPDVSRDADSGSSSGSFAQSSNKQIPFALGNMFENSGVKTYAYHNFRGYYYSREDTHPNLGYTTTRFMGGENGMKFTHSWPSSDLEMMEQSVGDYINNDRFHAYYMTFSGHGPYSDANNICVDNIDTVRKLAAGKGYDETALYYLAANYELEKAMTYLVGQLEAAGKLDNTMIVLTGDHYPYYLNTAAFNNLAGRKVEQNFEKYKSTCIMWCGGMEPVQVNTPCCNIDILPTVLNLFGFQYDSRLLPGTDIFSDSTHMAMLYNKSFVTDKVRYNAQTGKAEWFSSADSMTEDQKQAYLQYLIALTKNRYKMSLDIMSEDFYKFVYDNMTVQG
ncbi:MAG: LTA synthase family protein [Ruminococcaceae bacterium]|nr:LTA synthase family protein [Oscillospiraceae bacterium]